MSNSSSEMNDNNSLGFPEEEEEELLIEDEDDEEEEEEWEDFMVQYWKSSVNSGSTNNSCFESSTTSSHQSIVVGVATTTTTTTTTTSLEEEEEEEEEDTDLKPCEIEPDLDEELNVLSPIRTGCMDIDMDFHDHDDDNDTNNDTTIQKDIGFFRAAGSSNHDDDDDDDNNNNGMMNQWSMLGFECSRAMASVVSNMRSSSGDHMMNQRNQFESLKINVGMIRGGGGGGGGGKKWGGDGGDRSDAQEGVQRDSNTTIHSRERNDDITMSPSHRTSLSPSTLTVAVKSVHHQRTQRTSTTSQQTQQQQQLLQSQQQQQQPFDLDIQSIKNTAITHSDIDENSSVGRKSNTSLNTATTNTVTAAAAVGEDGGISRKKHVTTTTLSSSSSSTLLLPSPELVHATGPIMTRTSLRSLVMKKWHPSYWMQYGTYELLIFRSKDHMDDWRYNPYHGKKERDFLVKLRVDFMADMIVSSAEGSNPKEGILGHRVLPIKMKSYGKNEEDMYQFKLERWTNLGCSVLAAFASRDEDEVQLLHKSICEILKRCPNNGLRNIDHMLK